MATTITAGNATNGAAISSDNTGILELKSGTGSGTTAVTVSTGQNVTFAQAANLPNTFGFKNRIINGAMVIDQRNAGASVSLSTGSLAYPVDRSGAIITQGSGHTGQRSTVAPAGFVNSLLITVGTGASPTAGQISRIYQGIEGVNVADLGWGTANAQTITLSFWVRSSLTGTFAGGVYNGDSNRTYVFTYSISSANTWEQKTVTIAGDTSGSWNTGNGAGMYVNWDLGTGSTYQGTAGVWAAGAAWATSGSVKLAATSGATFYITGVQLEKGSTATSFDYRPYGTELQLCQRYYYRMTSVGIASTFAVGFNDSTTSCVGTTFFPVTMRTAPSALEQTGTAGDYRVRVTAANSITCSAVPAIASVGTTSYSVVTTFTVASGLTAGQGAFLQAVNATAYLGWSAEL